MDVRRAGASVEQGARRCRIGMTRLLSVLVLCQLAAFSSALAGTAAWGTDQVPRVRPTGPRAAYTLERGHARCPTIRALVTELQATDTIVYVTIDPRTAGLAATITFLGATPVSRFLRVNLRGDLTTRQMIIMLGHELQHALEVAHAPSIRDRGAFDAHYRCVGLNTPDPDRFDTRAALLAAERIKRELAIAGSIR